MARGVKATVVKATRKRVPIETRGARTVDVEFLPRGYSGGVSIGYN
jgi:hypothetical protein